MGLGSLINKIGDGGEKLIGEAKQKAGELIDDGAHFVGDGLDHVGLHDAADWVEDHGDTDVNLGILLCWHHHDQVHTRHIEIRRSPTGGWLFLTRHGRPVGNAV